MTDLTEVSGERCPETRVEARRGYPGKVQGNQRDPCLVAVRLYETGTAFDALLDLWAAKAMRNVNEMRRFLVLVPHETRLEALTRVVELAFKEGREYASDGRGDLANWLRRVVNAGESIEHFPGQIASLVAWPTPTYSHLF